MVYSITFNLTKFDMHLARPWAFRVKTLASHPPFDSNNLRVKDHAFCTVT